MKIYIYIAAFLLSVSPALRGVYLPSASPHILLQQSVHPKDLPEVIRKYITDNYNAAQILSARMEGSADSPTGYVVEINYKQQKISLIFDGKGKFLRKS